MTCTAKDTGIAVVLVNLGYVMSRGTSQVSGVNKIQQRVAVR